MWQILRQKQTNKHLNNLQSCLQREKVKEKKLEKANLNLEIQIILNNFQLQVQVYYLPNYNIQSMDLSSIKSSSSLEEISPPNNLEHPKLTVAQENLPQSCIKEESKQECVMELSQVNEEEKKENPPQIIEIIPEPEQHEEEENQKVSCEPPKPLDNRAPINEVQINEKVEGQSKLGQQKAQEVKPKVEALVKEQPSQHEEINVIEESVIQQSEVDELPLQVEESKKQTFYKKFMEIEKIMNDFIEDNEKHLQVDRSQKINIIIQKLPDVKDDFYFSFGEKDIDYYFNQVIDEKFDGHLEHYKTIYPHMQDNQIIEKIAEFVEPIIKKEDLEKYHRKRIDSLFKSLEPYMGLLSDKNYFLIEKKKTIEDLERKALPSQKNGQEIEKTEKETEQSSPSKKGLSIDEIRKFLMENLNSSLVEKLQLCDDETLKQMYENIQNELEQQRRSQQEKEELSEPQMRKATVIDVDGSPQMKRKSKKKFKQYMSQISEILKKIEQLVEEDP